MLIRRYEPGEESILWQLYFQTTHQVVRKEYTQEQCERWAPADQDASEWSVRLAKSQPFVAVLNDQLVGFAELLRDGEVDFFYCHHQYQRQGVGTALLTAVEHQARSTAVSMLTARVSTTAIHFFVAHGFEIVEETNRLVCGTPARQFRTQKQLSEQDLTPKRRHQVD